MNRDKEIYTGIDFRQKYKELSDAEIRDILLKRKSYQAEAAQAAIQEAISRGILQSEQDLFAKEYDLPAEHSVFFFPSIRKAEQKTKILASLHRVFYVLGAIPFAFSGMNFFREKPLPAMVFIVIGASWWFLNFRLSKSRNILIIYPMIVMLFSGFCYAMGSYFMQKNTEGMDYTVVTVAFFVSLYCLLFARSVLKS
ncbi:MAG: hypothetical protein RBS73_01130 [Prolixibacteraceae bacterium]|nr:hypothetical protein [Prolixibacteraceae bacterium]